MLQVTFRQLGRCGSRVARGPASSCLIYSSRSFVKKTKLKKIDPNNPKYESVVEEVPEVPHLRFSEEENSEFDPNLPLGFPEKVKDITELDPTLVTAVEKQLRSRPRVEFKRRTPEELKELIKPHLRPDGLNTGKAVFGYYHKFQRKRKKISPYYPVSPASRYAYMVEPMEQYDWLSPESIPEEVKEKVKNATGEARRWYKYIVKVQKDDAKKEKEGKTIAE